MNPTAVPLIEDVFQPEDGRQILLTSISACEEYPCNAGDKLLLQTPEGRKENTSVETIEFTLKTGGEEFYALTLKKPTILNFCEFAGGNFEVIQSEDAIHQSAINPIHRALIEAIVHIDTADCSDELEDEDLQVLESILAQLISLQPNEKKEFLATVESIQTMISDRRRREALRSLVESLQEYS